MSFGHLVTLEVWVPGERGRRIECRPDDDHLEITATVKWKQTGGDSKGTITAIGLSESTIGILSRDNARCRILGGYADEGSLATAMEGPVIPGSLQPPEGRPDAPTTWDISAGALPVSRVPVSRSWTFTTAITVLRYIAGVAGLRLEVADGVEDVEYPSGHTVYGMALSEIRGPVTDLGAAWRIDGTTLYLWPAGARCQPRAPRLSPDTGLIGMPRKAAKGQVRIRCTLLAHLRDGDPVVVESQYATGSYRAVEVTHSLCSTASADHLTDIVGRPL